MSLLLFYLRHEYFVSRQAVKKYSDLPLGPFPFVSPWAWAWESMSASSSMEGVVQQIKPVELRNISKTKRYYTLMTRCH